MSYSGSLGVIVTMTALRLAHGIIVPLLRTAEDATALVQSAKFPPVGQRGFGSPFSMEKFGGLSQTEYLQQANDSLLTIVQIETKEALQNVCSCTIAALSNDLWLRVWPARCHCKGSRGRRPVRWSVRSGQQHWSSYP